MAEDKIMGGEDSLYYAAEKLDAVLEKTEALATKEQMVHVSHQQKVLTVLFVLIGIAIGTLFFLI